MAIYSNSVDASGIAAFNAAPDIVFPFTPDSIAVINEHASQACEISFDGVNVAARLTPTLPSCAMTFEQSSRGLWVRRVGAAGTTLTVRATAETRS